MHGWCVVWLRIQKGGERGGGRFAHDKRILRAAFGGGGWLVGSAGQ